LFEAGDVSGLIAKLDWAKNADLTIIGKDNRYQAEYFTWSKIREKYVKLWRELTS